jgi:hypothetical protein
MTECVGHEFGDHELGRVGLQAPLLQRAPGELAGGLGRLRPRRQLAGGQGPVHQVAGGQVGQRERPGLGLGPAVSACRQEPVVAHASALRPYRRDELRVTRVACNFTRSDLGVPQCKRYHPLCTLQAQRPMHVHSNLRPMARGCAPVSWRCQVNRGFRKGLS